MKEASLVTVFHEESVAQLKKLIGIEESDLLIRKSRFRLFFKDNRYKWLEREHLVHIFIDYDHY